MPSPLTVTHDVVSAITQKWNATYATVCASGSAINTVAAGFLNFGQELSDVYYNFETFLEFDTSSIGAGQTITAVTLSFFCDTKPVTGSTAEVYAYAFPGATVATSDNQSSTQVGALTLAASITAASLSTSAYVALTGTAALLTAINPTGKTKLLVTTSKYRLATAPTAPEWGALTPYNNANPGAKLVVTYTAATTNVAPIRRIHAAVSRAANW